MTATVTGGGPVTGQPAPVRRLAARRRRFAFPRGSTTPGKVRLIRLGLVIACLGWGALAALMVGQHASAAGDAASVSEPLSLDAQQMYQSLANADVTASTGYETMNLISRTGDADFQQDFRGTLFSRLEADLAAAIRADQVTFADSAAAGSGAFTGLEAGIVVLALIMAVGSAWGLSRRLAEYR